MEADAGKCMEGVPAGGRTWCVGAGTRKPLAARTVAPTGLEPVQFLVTASGPTPPPAGQGGFCIRTNISYAGVS